MTRIALLALLLSLTAGCAAWTPCPEKFVLSGSLERGTVNGADLAKVITGGEADGVDSNYEGYSVGGELHFPFREPRFCPTLGGSEPSR